MLQRLKKPFDCSNKKYKNNKNFLQNKQKLQRIEILESF